MAASRAGSAISPGRPGGLLGAGMPGVRMVHKCAILLTNVRVHRHMLRNSGSKSGWRLAMGGLGWGELGWGWAASGADSSTRLKMSSLRPCQCPVRM